jgi:hypothetical protein
MPEILCASIYRLRSVFCNDQSRMAIRTRLATLHPLPVIRLSNFLRIGTLPWSLIPSS